MHVHSQIFKRPAIEENRPITLIVWVLGRVEKKMPGKGQKSEKNNYFCFKQIFKSVTHVSVFIFKGFLKI